jgi:hypothetical protein
MFGTGVEGNEGIWRGEKQHHLLKSSEASSARPSESRSMKRTGVVPY